MGKIEEFKQEVQQNIEYLRKDEEFKICTKEWMDRSISHKYSYNFEWMGRPIIQYPQDIMAMQEIIWNVKPDLIIETGIAHGGSVVFYAAMLELLGGDRKVLGIDVDIREHNKREIEKHPMAHRIQMIEGSSIDETIVEKIKCVASSYKNILLVLDSNHTQQHVLRELDSYSELVSRGSYIVVFDTIVEGLSDDACNDRPWGRGNNPRTAVQIFLRKNNRFEVDEKITQKLAITVCEGGYLKCIK